MVAETINNEQMSSTTQYYMDCKEDIEAFEKKVMEMDKSSQDFENWLFLSKVFYSFLHVLGGIFSDVREVKNKMDTKSGKSKKELTPLQIILFQGFITLIVFIAGWFFTEIAPRIFSIPHP